MNLDPPASESRPPTLADLLETRREDLLQRWSRQVHEGLPPGPHPRAELEAHLVEALSELTRRLRQHQVPGEKPVPRWPPVAREHEGPRVRPGVDVQALVREYHVLRECILDVVEETGARITLGELRTLEAFITTGIAEGVAGSPRPRDAGGLERDLTACRRAEQTQAFLIEAGSVLSQSLDVATTLKKLASLAVKHVCDFCMVDLLGEDGQLHRLEVATRHPELDDLIQRSRPYPPRMGGNSPLIRALESGEPVPMPELTPAWLDAAAQNAEHRAILEALGPRSAALIPLVARGRRLGIINLAWTRPHYGELDADLEVARGLADRAALAIDNARLYEEAQEAIRVRENVVAIVSHDLRNPLNAISLSATLLEREAVDERTARTAHRIAAAADRAGGMIRDLLDFTQARVGGGIPIHPQPLDIHEQVRRAVEEVRLAWPGRHIHIEASGDGRGEADEGRLPQVVTNLVGNALQHSPPGTPVRVATRGEAASLLLEVHNRGRAIPAELLPTLFEPYRQGPEAGGRRGSLGLGLYITRQIVLGHGGTLEVRSTEEDGTTFTVRLPRSPAGA